MLSAWLGRQENVRDIWGRFFYKPDAFLLLDQQCQAPNRTQSIDTNQEITKLTQQTLAFLDASTPWKGTISFILALEH